MPPPPTYANGAVLAQRFRILRRIGEGGMGVVYEALDLERQQRVALKSITYPDASAIFRFKREFRALADIAHPNLVPLYELVSDGEHWFFTMQLVEGQDLARFLRPPLKPSAAQHASATGGADEPSTPPGARSTVEHAYGAETTPDRPRPPQPPKPSSDDYDWARVDFARVRSVFTQVVSAVRALHEANRLHRDLKPSNVLVRADGTAVVLDFGLVAEIDAVDATPRDPANAARVDATLIEARSSVSGASIAGRAMLSDEIVTGTIPYMAPEQVTGEPLTSACDWYAVGVMLFQACTGRLPHEGAPSKLLANKLHVVPPAPSLLNASVPKDVDALCVSLLAQSPEARPHGSAILEQLGAKRSSQRTALDLSRRPFVGRRQELAALRESLARVRSGSTELICVRGAHGQGKSSLLDHFARTELGDATVLRGRCFEHESVPFKTIDGVVDALVRQLLSTRYAELEALDPRDVAAAVQVFPVLARSGEIYRKSRAAEIDRDRATVESAAIAVLRTLLRALASRRPLVIVVDDAQWGDAEGARALASLWDAPSVAAMVLLSFRADLEEDSPALRELAAQRASRPAMRRIDVDVGELARDDSRELVRTLLAKNHAVAEDALWVERIVDWSDGSPWLIELLLESYASLGAIARGQSLDVLLRARASALSEPQRELLEIVCLSPRPLATRVALDAAFGRIGEPDALVALTKAQLLKTTGPALDDLVEPFHPRVREAIVRTMRAEDRQRASERLAFAVAKRATRG